MFYLSAHPGLLHKYLVKLAGPDYIGRSVNLMLWYKHFVQKRGSNEQDADVPLINTFLHTAAGYFGLNLDQLRIFLRDIDR